MDLDVIGALAQLSGWYVNATPAALTARPALSSYRTALSPLRVVWAGDSPTSPALTVALQFASEAEARAQLTGWWPRDNADTAGLATLLGVNSPALVPSGPVVSTANGQVIEGLDITAPDGTHGVTVNHAGVTVRRNRISHRHADGIRASGSGVIIQDVIATYRTPAAGFDTSPGSNITVSGGGSPLIERVRLTGGAAGIYCLNSPGARLRFIQGLDIRGPGPRGQLVQFDKCAGGVLEDFSCVNSDATSWPEDMVSVYQSPNAIVRRGLVDGNNSQTGVGIMFEGSDGGLCEEVDAVRQLNGSFFSSASANVLFRNCRSRNQRNSDVGRGLPSSNSLTFGSIGGSTNTIYDNCAYFAQANPSNIGLGFNYATSSIRSQDFPSRTALNMLWAWE